MCLLEAGHTHTRTQSVIMYEVLDELVAVYAGSQELSAVLVSGNQLLLEKSLYRAWCVCVNFLMSLSGCYMFSLLHPDSRVVSLLLFLEKSGILADIMENSLGRRSSCH